MSNTNSLKADMKNSKALFKIKYSKIHGKGVFARENIKKGIKIIQYIGEKISKKEGDNRSEKRLKRYLNSNKMGSVYIFELNNRYDIDGSPIYNKARYINHSCRPNCEVKILNGHIWIYSLKNIKKDDELSYDYGYEFDKDDYVDHICLCGSKNCIGYIISSDDRQKFRRHIRKKNEKK
tara:strand:+ start:4431 stop:4967 length:537 start_codon:yes stop_codon:yes gene_type:complete